MAQILEILSIISFAVAGLAFVIAVFCWFFLRIPKVIGDLSGRTAKKSIEKMRVSNEKTGSKIYRESRTNVDRGRLTDAMDSNKSSPGDEAQEPIRKQNARPHTSRTAERDVTPETSILEGSKTYAPVTEETAYLGAEGNQNCSQETAWLGSDETELIEEKGATTRLAGEQKTVAATGNRKQLQMIESVMLIHTDEVIEC